MSDLATVFKAQNFVRLSLTVFEAELEKIFSQVFTPLFDKFPELIKVSFLTYWEYDDNGCYASNECVEVDSLVSLNPSFASDSEKELHAALRECSRYQYEQKSFYGHNGTKDVLKSYCKNTHEMLHYDMQSIQYFISSLKDLSLLDGTTFLQNSKTKTLTLNSEQYILNVLLSHSFSIELTRTLNTPKNKAANRTVKVSARSSLKSSELFTHLRLFQKNLKGK